MFNSLGNILQLTTFGESHGTAIGGVLDGFPAGIELNFHEIQYQLNRRKPGQSILTTPRKESDKVQFLSGIFEGKTTGHSIGFLVNNTDPKSKDYSHIQDVYRPSHADFVYDKKYGIRDYKGGGRSSARETTNWVIAGSLAQHIIPNISVNSFVSQIGKITLENPYQELDFSAIDTSLVRCPDEKKSSEMIEYLKQIKKEGDTIGGSITCVVKNAPVGLGEPIFHKIQAELAKAMMSINAAKAFSIGSGFDAAYMKGSEHNDVFLSERKTKTNFSGGVQGGISNGMDIYFTVTFKPVATLLKPQQTINVKGNITTIEGKGRHDACVVPRAVPIVDALTKFVLADAFLMNKSRHFH